jgi:hypothetical protein
MTNSQSIQDGAPRSDESPGGRGTDHAEPDVILAESLESASGNAVRIWRSRRKRIPILLFLITCLSTFFAGALSWLPDEYLLRWLLKNDGTSLRRVFLLHWQDGLIYM